MKRSIGIKSKNIGKRGCISLQYEERKALSNDQMEV